MAIFPNIETESVIQVDDKFRIKADKSFVSKDEASVTLVEIEPHTGDGYIDVTGSSSADWYLDWEYSTDGTKTISVRVTTDGSPVTVTKDVTAITEADDKLFSTDADLALHETSILKYLPEGKNTFKYIHRLCQNQILEQLYKDGYLNNDGSKISKSEVLDIEEFSQWSKYMALRLIFRDLSNAIDDIYDRKSNSYENDEHKWRNKAILKIDVNKDGLSNDNEEFDMTTRKLVRG